jgi:hypothetical protein
MNGQGISATEREVRRLPKDFSLKNSGYGCNPLCGGERRDNAPGDAFRPRSFANTMLGEVPGKPDRFDTSDADGDGCGFQQPR